MRFLIKKINLIYSVPTLNLHTFVFPLFIMGLVIIFIGYATH